MKLQEVTIPIMNLKKCAKGWTRENRFFSVSELGGAADAITSQ